MSKKKKKPKAREIIVEMPQDFQPMFEWNKWHHNKQNSVDLEEWPHICGVFRV